LFVFRDHDHDNEHEARANPARRETTEQIAPASDAKVKPFLAVASNAPEEILMNGIQAFLGALVALAVPALPSVARAQDTGSYTYDPYGVEEPYSYPAVPAPITSTVNIAPPAYASVFVYEGRRLMSRFDGPGALWLPAGHVYRVIAMRGDQVVWSGNISTTGAPIDLRWGQRAYYGYGRQYQYGRQYPQTAPPSPPVEWGRERTPLP
jgi:hypothetical protein